MNALRTVRVVLELVLIVGLAVAVVLQQHEISNLRAQNREAADPNAQTAQGAEPDNQPGVGGGAGQAESQSPQDAEKERSELLRLRSEVTRLRAQEAELAKVRQENTNLVAQAQVLRNRLVSGAFAQNSLPLSSTPDVPPMNAYVGIQITTVQNDSDFNGRVMVSGVMDNSPAAEAKLQEGDVVLSVNGEPITNLVQLRTITGSSIVGQPLVFDLVRDNHAAQVTVLPKPPPAEFVTPRPQTR